LEYACLVGYSNRRGILWIFEMIKSDKFISSVIIQLKKDFGVAGKNQEL
jgi:hypothetical protein